MPTGIYKKRIFKKFCIECAKQYETKGNFSLRCVPCRRLHKAKYLYHYACKNQDKINARLRGKPAHIRREKFPEKVKARDILNNAIKNGKIKKGKCAVCHSTKRIHGHHRDYSKPLKVEWLCPAHHKKLHI